MDSLESLMKVTVALFMLGNLFDMGLRLRLDKARESLRDLRFVGAILLWGFVLLPALAWGLARLAPIAPGYATGLVLLGMAPAAPFLPPMVDRARGSLDLAATTLLVTAIGTVVYMPLAVPLLVPGLTASAIVIAKPLVQFLLLPLALGILMLWRFPAFAGRIHPWVKVLTGIDTLLMLLLCILVYGKGFMTLAGTGVIALQLAFFAAATVLPYALGFGLDRGERVVLSLGMATRNLGAAFAPLFAVTPPDRSAIVTVALGVVMQTAFSYGAATFYAKRPALERSQRP